MTLIRLLCLPSFFTISPLPSPSVLMRHLKVDDLDQVTSPSGFFAFSLIPSWPVTYGRFLTHQTFSSFNLELNKPCIEDKF